MAGLEEVLDEIRRVASACMYCGFCEPVCPTLRHGPHRGYGPRGRVMLALRLAEEMRASGEMTRAFYSCLLCGACRLACPAGIDAGVVSRLARAALQLLPRGSVEWRDPEPVEVLEA